MPWFVEVLGLLRLLRNSGDGGGGRGEGARDEMKDGAIARGEVKTPR
jgi:hypothetical protein